MPRALKAGGHDSAARNKIACQLPKELVSDIRHSQYLRHKTIWELTVNITEEQAAHIYARACKAWYGPRAQRIVRKKIRQLEQQGDRGGVVARTAVAHQLSRVSASGLKREL
jgi:hypothetical protein